MNLSSNIQIKVICNNQPVENIVLQLIIHAGRKNTYSILSLKSKNNGVCEIPIELIKSNILHSNNTFIMDYDGSYECASSIIKIELLDKKSFIDNKDNFLIYPISDYDKNLWGTAEEMYSYYASCSNECYSGQEVIVDIEEQRQFLYEVIKKY